MLTPVVTPRLLRITLNEGIRSLMRKDPYSFQRKDLLAFARERLGLGQDNSRLNPILDDLVREGFLLEYHAPKELPFTKSSSLHVTAKARESLGSWNECGLPLMEAAR